MNELNHQPTAEERTRHQAIDQYYMEHFLELHRDDIRGRVLEIQPSHYARTLVAEVEHLDIVDIRHDNPEVSQVRDLARDDSLPPGRYDCFLLAGSGHQIYELEVAVQNATRALRPGGVMLAAFPCVAPLDETLSEEHDYWRFTASLARRLFESHFGPGHVEIEQYGNALSASAILKGCSVDDLTTEELDWHDASTPVVIGVRAVRPSWCATDEADLNRFQARYPYLYPYAVDPAPAEAEFRVTALISAYNEGDLIEPVIAHLIENGIDVFLIDNHSTDDTVAQASRWLGRGLLGIETFPNPSGGANLVGRFAWEDILLRKLALAQKMQATWFIHHDADEFRESPWPSATLREAIQWVDRLGYNAVDFRLLNFPPVDDGFQQGVDPRRYFTRYEEGAEYDRVQIKCWKFGVDDVELADGGHEVRFSDRRVFPIPFILRHYPIRGQTHGMRKVLSERKNRFLETELARGWHVQYDSIKGDEHLFLRNPASLKPFDLEHIRLQALLTRKQAFPEEISEANADNNSFEGFLEYAGYDRIIGWAWSGQPDGEPVSVDIWDGSHLLGTVRAHRFRQDLRDNGKGDGYAAFVFVPPASLADGRPHLIWANLAGTSLALYNSPHVLEPR